MFKKIMEIDFDSITKSGEEILKNAEQVKNDVDEVKTILIELKAEIQKNNTLLSWIQERVI